MYKEISANSILVSGGQTTVANLFYNMGRKTVGLVGLWDCVAFDEVAGINFKDKDGIQIMKDYMASGSFARGKEEKAASASMVFVGNINQSVDVLLKTSGLFDPFPLEMGADTAFLDRIHCYLPGWEIPKFRPEHFTDDYGFITDYLAEFIRELRKEQYGDALDEYFRLGKNLNQRDTIAVRKMVGGLIKIVYPDGVYTREQLEEILQLVLEMRRRVKEQLKKLGGMEFYDVNFSYIDIEDMSEHYVSVPEQGGGRLIPEGMCNPGQVYTVSRGIVTTLEKYQQMEYNKNMSYPIKYRERTMEYRQEGHTLEETKQVFRVSIATIRKWEKQLKEEGHLKKKPLNRSFRKIDPEKLRSYVTEHPDACQSEMAKEFQCSESGIRNALKQLKITRKKRAHITKNKRQKK